MTLLADDRGAGGTDGAVGGTTPSAELTDGELLAAVRAGDSQAYATLYELHNESVRRLARRLCRDAHEADDVVSEVFANTLRAIQRGGGPRDEFALYALRSVRNTVTKLRTRTDTARATPTELPALDRESTDDSYHLTGDVERAFAELPERFQEVLWTTAVEGRTPTELSGERLDPSAVASLSQRARRALGRSYLRVCTQRPCRDPECGRVRNHLPGYVQHSAAPATVRRIEAHLAHCRECAEVGAEMRNLNGKLRTTPWMALLAAAVRRLVLSVSTAGAQLATAAAPMVAIAVAGVVVGVAVARDHPDAPGDAAAAIGTSGRLERLPAPGAEPVETGGAASGSNAAGAPGDVTTGGTFTVESDSTTAVQLDVLRAPGATAAPTSGAPAVIVNPLVTIAGALAPAGSAPNAGSVVGTALDGTGSEIVPAVTDATGGLLDDVDGTLDRVGEVVTALPGGFGSTLDATGSLVGQLDSTVSDAGGSVSDIGAAAGQTVGATVTTLVATVDQTTSGLGGAVDEFGAAAGETVGDVTGGEPDAAPADVDQTATTLVSGGASGVSDPPSQLVCGLLGCG